MPTEVWTATDLNNVRNNLSGSYVQMGDIDLSGYANWTPIGKGWTAFTGGYNGQDYYIENLTVLGADDYLHGLFGYTDGGAELRNIRFKDATIDRDGKESRYVGCLVGWAENTSIIECSAVGGVSGLDYVGGLFGYADSCMIEKSFYRGPVIGYFNVGGLIGESYGNTMEIEDCFARGSVDKIADMMTYAPGGFGGLIGAAGNIALVKNCYAASPVWQGPYTPFAPAPEKSGGLLGISSVGSVADSYYDSDVSGMSDTGKGDPRTTAEMTHPAASNTYVGWDFTLIWTHDTTYTINAGYPYLYAVEITFAVHSKISAAWKSGPAWVKVGGAWKKVTDGWCKVGGVWKKIVQ